MCNKACLELGKDTVPQLTLVNCLQRIDINRITYKNAFPICRRGLLSQRKVKYSEDIIVTRDTAKLGMSRREVIHAISDIGQASYYYQA